MQDIIIAVQTIEVQKLFDRKDKNKKSDHRQEMNESRAEFDQDFDVIMFNYFIVSPVNDTLYWAEIEQISDGGSLLWVRIDHLSYDANEVVA